MELDQGMNILYQDYIKLYTYIRDQGDQILGETGQWNQYSILGLYQTKQLGSKGSDTW